MNVKDLANNRKDLANNRKGKWEGVSFTGG